MMDKNRMEITNGNQRGEKRYGKYKGIIGTNKNQKKGRGEMVKTNNHDGGKLRR